MCWFTIYVMLVGGLFGYIVYFLFLLPDVYPNDSNGTFKPNVCFRIEIALREHPVHVSNSSWVVVFFNDRCSTWSVSQCFFLLHICTNMASVVFQCGTGLPMSANALIKWKPKDESRFAFFFSVWREKLIDCDSFFFRWAIFKWLNLDLIFVGDLYSLKFLDLF